MTQDEAKAIIESEPVGGAHYYSDYTDRFFIRSSGVWYRFDSDKWVMHKYVPYSVKPMHEILAIALGDKND